MKNTITPQSVRDYAVSQLTPITHFLANAGVAKTVFYKWEVDGKKPGPITMEKLRRALVGGKA